LRDINWAISIERYQNDLGRCQSVIRKGWVPVFQKDHAQPKGQNGRFKEKSSSGLYHAERKEVTMAEINKLSVGKVLDKLRSNGAPKKTKTMLLDENAKAVDEEIQRLRAATRRLKPGRADTTGRD
jgi:hypothetical protein